MEIACVIAPALALSVLASFIPTAGEAFEIRPEFELVVEATIPFNPSRSILHNHDFYLTFGFGSLWMVNHPNLVRIDPVDYHTREIELAGIVGPVRLIEIGDGAVWVADTGTNTIYKADPVTNRVVLKISAFMLSRDSRLGVGAGSLWVVTGEHGEHTLSRFNSVTGARQAAIELPAAAAGTVFAYGAAWVVGTGGDALYRIDPATNAVAGVTPLKPEPRYIIAAEGSIWVNSRKGWLHRIDSQTGAEIAVIETGLIGNEQLTAGGGFVWLATTEAAVVQIDPATNTIVRAYTGNHLLSSPDTLYAEGSLWTVQRLRAILRIKPPLQN